MFITDVPDPGVARLRRCASCPSGRARSCVELADLDATLALFDALAADPLDGIAEMVPAARTLMVRLRARNSWRTAARRAQSPRGSSRPGAAPDPTEVVEIPVSYDGEDLADVAEHLGLSRRRGHRGASGGDLAGRLLRLRARASPT